MIQDKRLGNTLRWWLYPSKDWGVRVPDEVNESVAFVGRIVRKGSQETRVLGGTAFLVAFPSTTVKDISYIYLVTAKHVAQQVSHGGTWFVRMNNKDGESVDMEVPGPVEWCYHLTEGDSVDAAVIQPHLPLESFHYRAIQTTMFATDDVIRERHIGPGDLVFMTGLFTRMTGRKKNISIVRMGNVAMMPSETIPLIGPAGESVEREVYLIEARSIGGLSGSPTFVCETLTMRGEVEGDDREVQAVLPGRFYLLGLMRGHWDVKEEDINEAYPRIVPSRDRQGVNMGIALVVPAKKILEIILQHPTLVRGRQEYERRRLSEMGPITLD
jgi:hypothetical protein